MGMPHPHVKDQPADFPFGEAWITDRMELPRPRDHDCSRPQRMVFPVDHDRRFALKRHRQFDPLVAVGRKAMPLLAGCMPNPEGANARRFGRAQAITRIVAARQRVQRHGTFADSLCQRQTVVRALHVASRFEKHGACLSSVLTP
jgi:hypothetical protein